MNGCGICDEARIPAGPARVPAPSRRYGRSGYASRQQCAHDRSPPRWLLGSKPSSRFPRLPDTRCPRHPDSDCALGTSGDPDEPSSRNRKRIDLLPPSASLRRVLMATLYHGCGTNTKNASARMLPPYAANRTYPACIEWPCACSTPGSTTDDPCTSNGRAGTRPGTARDYC